jgi:hypothetical protein
LAPRARFELATLRLTAECSTIELPGNGQVRTLVYNTLNQGATLSLGQSGYDWVPTSTQSRLHLRHFGRAASNPVQQIGVRHIASNPPSRLCYRNARRPCRSMITVLEDPSNHKPGRAWSHYLRQTLALRLVELWLSAVLAAFFFVRVLGSETARHILSRILPSHVR